jgi:choloylglycine hydrolase
MAFMLVLALCFLLVTDTARSCTGIRLKSSNGGIVYARTLEFGQPLDSKIILIPRRYRFHATAPSGKPEGLCWRARYAAVGPNALGLPILVDGVNEKGLAGGLFYFPGYAEYQEVTKKQWRQSLAPWELMTWILTRCASVSDVKKLLPTIFVSKTVFKHWKIIPPVHAIVHDQGGNSLVIEYVNGKLNFYENPLGIITNAPTFDWHVTNLRNYTNISALGVPKIQLRDIKLAPFGQGSGMLGLPGDFTSPSRFVRAVAFSQAITIPATEHEAVHAAFHVLNLFDIPKGVIREREREKIVYDHTQWTSAADLHNKRYYIHTYTDRQIKMINLMQARLRSKKRAVIPLESKSSILDITPSEACV